jgi:uncharacterized protein YbjT (DUF2867 family)
MAAPEDIGKFAADLLTREIEDANIKHIEGPEHYSATDVANAFAKELGSKITVKTIHEEDWINTMRSLGFSEKAAISFAGMTKLAQQEDLEKPASPVKGNTSLEEYIGKLVKQKSAMNS